MKKKRIGILVVMIIIGICALIFFNLPKPVEAFDASYDLMKITDGAYVGACDNGLVKVEVTVSIKDHTISDVQIRRHDNGMGADAEAITDKIIQQQSVEVDTIAGATFSSKTILKAVENALIESEEIE